jgi:Protein of unknown function (DUF2384)
LVTSILNTRFRSLAHDILFSFELELELTSANRRPLFFYEILSVKPGDSYRSRNLFTDEDFEVVERSGSRDAQIGSIILSSIFHVDGRWQNMVTAPYMLRPIDKQSILMLREEIKKRLRSKSISEVKLNKFVIDIRTLYLGRIQSLLEPSARILTNTDGELLVPQTLHKQLEAARLKPCGEETDEEPSPELIEQMKALSEAHWAKWMNEPIPALNGMTPIEASKTKIGKDLLKSLLLYYEQQDNNCPENLFRPDFKTLRKKLGV